MIVGWELWKVVDSEGRHVSGRRNMHFFMECVMRRTLLNDVLTRNLYPTVRRD